MLLNIFLNTPPSPPSTNPLLDAGWVGVGVTILIGIATIVTTIVITVWAVRKQRNKKEIMYQVISDAPLVSINEVVRDKVEIRLEGKVVNNARLLVLKVWNSGNMAIKRDDYDEPITFEFLKRNIISSEVIQTQPKNLIEPKQIKTFLNLQPHSVEMTKFLLNSNESIILTILTSDTIDKIHVRGRIIDGKIEEFDLEKERRTFYLFRPIVILFIGYFAMVLMLELLNYFLTQKLDNTFIFLGSIAAIIIAAIVGIGFALWERKPIGEIKFKLWK
jgi:hypothetical protein